MEEEARSSVDAVMTSPDILFYIFFHIASKILLDLLSYNDGEIRFFNRAFYKCCRTFMPFSISKDSFAAWSAERFPKVTNVVSLELSVEVPAYKEFVERLEPSQLRSLDSLHIHIPSSYDEIVETKFITHIVPEIEKARGGAPLKLSKLTVELTSVSGRPIDIFQALAAPDASGLSQGEQTLLRLFQNCSAIEIRGPFGYYQAACILAMASSATTLLLWDACVGPLYPIEEEASKVLKYHGFTGFAHFDTFVIRNQCPKQETDSSMMQMLCNNVFAEYQLLTNLKTVFWKEPVVGVCVINVSVPSAEKVVYENVSLLNRDNSLMDLKTWARRTNSRFKWTFRKFPNVRTIKIELKDSATIVENFHEKCPWFLGVTIGILLENTPEQSKGGLVLELCEGTSGCRQMNKRER